jgi:chromosome partitioning protein
VALEKGGVAKTTTAHAIGAGLAQKGFQVLLVDLDAQLNLTDSVKAQTTERSVFDILVDRIDPEEVMQRCGDNLYILPSSRAVSRVEMFLSGGQAGEYRLAEALEGIKGDFDYCIIDTPPALGILTANALTAADKVVIPCNADMYSLGSIVKTNNSIETVKKYSNKSLEVAGLLFTRYNPRNTISKSATEEAYALAEQLGLNIFDTYIREGVAVKEAQALRQDIFTYAPNSNPANDYSKFLNELLEVIQND